MNEQEKAAIEKELRRLEKRDGKIFTTAVVDAARSKTSPLHAHFEWDDSKAAEQHRLHQARQLIETITVERGPLIERAFTSVITEQPKTGGVPSTFVRAYVNTERVLKDPSLRQQVLNTAIAEIERWATKYRNLEELDTITRAVFKLSNQLKIAA
jgi:hypothetical protein